MSGEPETEQANEQANEELVKQDSNMWEFEGPAEGEDAESPATNGQTEVKQEDKDGDMAMGDAVPANGASKHASIPAPAKSADAAKPGTPVQTQQGKQAGPKFGSGVNQGKPFAGGRQHRYFVLKSKSMFNVDASVEKGIWATQVCHCISSVATSRLPFPMTIVCRQHFVRLYWHTPLAGSDLRQHKNLKCTDNANALLFSKFSKTVMRAYKVLGEGHCTPSVLQFLQQRPAIPIENIIRRLMVSIAVSG